MDKTVKKEKTSVEKKAKEKTTVKKTEQAAKAAAAPKKRAVKPKAGTEGAVAKKKAPSTRKKVKEAPVAGVVRAPVVPPKVPVEAPKPAVPVEQREPKSPVPFAHTEPAPAPKKEESKAEIPVKAGQPKVQGPQPVVAPVVPPSPSVVQAPAGKELEITFPVTVKDMSVKLQEKPSVVIKKLMEMGVMAGINQTLTPENAQKLAQKFAFTIKEALGQEEAVIGVHQAADDTEDLVHRPPIVTFMGHVDHGKTSLLDAVRKSKVVDSEHGGITQHIGAYKVAMPKGSITFLDTPGHEAFTAMRARGAQVTDIVVLVVAADDGIMPQTREAIDHARAAGVSIIVAINKIDKPQAQVDVVKKQLSQLELVAEDWGGKTITVPVSAKTGQGIDTLLEMILLEAEILELKANPNRPAKGIVLESKLVRNKGPVATLLVENGTMKLNNNVLVGTFFGKIKAMFDDHGRSVKEAGPSTPVEVLGITGIPQAGEQFFAIEDEKTAKELASRRLEKERQKQMTPAKRMGLEDLYSQIKEGKLKELKIILKADAQGSIEAIKETLGKINTEEIKLSILHEGVGTINSSDVILAVASNALIFGFNVTADDQAKALIDKEGQDVRIYNIIYELVNEIRAAIEGMLEPKLKKVFLGRAEVRKVFRLSTSGVVAGSYVSKGKIARNARVEVIRNGASVFEGEISSLKRFKDDVREVEEGYECGITLKNFPDVLEGDLIEAFQIQKIARTLE